ncbi:MAG: DUF6036 family nucleotidyltransferase [Phycisphaerae bacterium]
MSEQFDLLGQVAGILERLEIRYLITGSFATMFYGEYRSTNDIDIVADLQSQHVKPFCAAFPDSEFLLSEEAVWLAVRERFQFNIIHKVTFTKIDVIVPALTPFAKSTMGRVRRLNPAPTVQAWVSAPEDVILNKLLFYKEGGSDKHLRDIAGVLRISGAAIDLAYLTRWAEELGVRDLWELVQQRAAEKR